MDEVQTSALQEDTADAGAVTGDSLFEQYENGASIDELNAMLETSDAEQEESSHEDAETAEQQESSSQEDASNPEETTTQQDGAVKKERTYTQKDFDRVIGRRVGEEQRKQAALLEDLSALLGVERTQVADTIRRQRLEAEAEANGVQDKELYARAKQLEQQQAAMYEQQAAEQAYRSKIADLQQQGQAIGADIVQLSENDAFVNMVNSLYRDPATRGNAVQMAYHAVFFNDAVKAAAQAERDKVISSVKAGQMRVSEGAAGKTAGAAVKLDVGKLSDDQIADMVARAQNGEKITFN